MSGCWYDSWPMARLKATSSHVQKYGQEYAIRVHLDVVMRKSKSFGFHKLEVVLSGTLSFFLQSPTFEMVRFNGIV